MSPRSGCRHIATAERRRAALHFPRHGQSLHRRQHAISRQIMRITLVTCISTSLKATNAFADSAREAMISAWPDEMLTNKRHGVLKMARLSLRL